MNHLKKRAAAPTIERLREVISYCRDTGEFLWLKTLSARAVAGKSAGGLCNGYRYISIDGYRTGAQRVAIALSHGSWPEGEVDHIDTNPLNNAINNLRAVSGGVNRQNVRRARSHSRTGILGVNQIPSGRYRAHITAQGQSIYSSVVDTADEASTLYVELKRNYHEGCTL